MNIRTELHKGKLVLNVNWLIVAAVVLTVVSLGRLGFWQLGRAEEKLALQQALEVEQTRKPIPVQEIDSADLNRQNPQLHNLQVTLEGEYLNERTILMHAQFFNGMIGYAVVTPFQVNNSEQLVLVNRGWTTGFLAPDAEISLRPVDGPQTLIAQVHAPQVNDAVITSQIDANVWPLQVRNLEPEIISQILNRDVFPFEVRLTADQPGVLVRHWPAVNVDINNNISYAIQWFSFALVVLLIGFFSCSNAWALLNDDRS